MLRPRSAGPTPEGADKGTLADPSFRDNAPIDLDDRHALGEPDVFRDLVGVADAVEEASRVVAQMAARFRIEDDPVAHRRTARRARDAITNPMNITTTPAASVT